MPKPENLLETSDPASQAESEVLSVHAVAEHVSALRAYFQRRVRNAADVDDYVQDVYLRVLAAGPAKKVDSVRGFLLRIASSLVVDRFRRDKARMTDKHIPIDDRRDIADNDAASPERALLARHELTALTAALDDIDPLGRRAFWLVRIDGLSHREAAQALGVDVKVVSRQVERVLARMGRVLAGPGDQ